ncbi:hypothetical protein Tco_1273859 [Tanacetum coccineum]
MKFNCPDPNVDCPPPTCQFQVFQSVCKSIGLRPVTRIDHQELKKVIRYVLHNSPEIETYQAKFKSEFPNQDMKEEFLGWFESQIRQRHIDKDPGVSASSELFTLAYGPTSTPISVNSCIVNGVRCPADVKHEVTAVTVAENDLHPPYQYPLRSKQSQSEQNSTRKPHLGLHEKSEAGCIPARILTNFIKASRIQIGPVPKLERHVRIRLPPWKSASTLLSREMPPEQKRGSWQILGMRMTEATGSRSPTPPRVWPYTEDEIMPWHGHSLPHLKAHELHRYRNAQKKGEAAHETSEQCSYGEREEGRNTIRKPLRHTYPVRQCRPGNVSPATSRPGNPGFVPRDSGKCCSDS